MPKNIFNQQYEKSVIDGLSLSDLFGLALKKLGKEPENREPTTDDVMTIAFDAMIEVSPFKTPVGKCWFASHIEMPDYLYQTDKNLHRAILVLFLLMPPFKQESSK